MKTTQSFKTSRGLHAAAALAALLAASVATAQNQGSSSTGSTTASRQTSNASAANVKVTRATTFIGTDVTASDGRKVGDIADYAFDVSAAPHLKYVIVVTDGFLGYGGDARAVPAEAVSMQGDSARLDIASDRYWNVAVMPRDRMRFLGNRSNTERLMSDFNLGNQDRAGSNNQQNPASRNQNSQDRTNTLVTFSELQNADVYGRDGERLGRFVDTWLSLDRNRAPYAEISSPPNSPFEVTPRSRYAIPLNQLQANSEDVTGYRFNITADELERAELVSETNGVRMLQSGEIGEQILRVRVAQR